MGKKKKRRKNTSSFCVQAWPVEWPPSHRPMKVQWLKRNKTGNEAGHLTHNTAAPFFFFFCANFVRKQNKRALSTRSIAPCKTGRTSDDHSHRQHCPHNSEMGESMLDCTQEATFPTTQRTRWRSFSGRGNRRMPMGRKWLLACNSGNQRKRPENAKARQQTLRLKEVARS